MIAPPLFTTSLSELERADLIRRLRELEEVYQFKHNLIQESAYSSLLRTDRRALHLSCAHALEHAYEDDLDEYAPLLVLHYAGAGDETKTFEYARRAAAAAMRTHSLPEALMHYDTAALVASRLPLAAAALLDVHLKRTRVLEVSGSYSEAEAAYNALAALGQSRAEPEIQIGAGVSLATLYIFPNERQDLDKGLQLNQAALAQARELGYAQWEARALWNMQQHAYFTGRTREAVAYSEQALEIVDRLDMPELRAYILNDVSRSLMSNVSVTAALNALEQARAYWRASDNLPMLVDNLSATCEVAITAGFVEMAESYGEQALNLSRTIGNTWNHAYSLGNLMQLYAQRGETCRALETGTAVNDLAKVSGFYVSALIVNVQTAGILGEMGQPARGIELLESGDMVDFLFLKVWHLGTRLLLYLVRGDITAARPVYEQARPVLDLPDFSSYGPVLWALCSAELALQEKRFADAVQAARGLLDWVLPLGIRQFTPELLLREGLGYLGLDDLDAAGQVLAEAERVTREMQARPVLWRILEAQSELELRGGNVEHAQALRKEAAALIHTIAADAPADLAASFLAQPRVRALLEA